MEKRISLERKAMYPLQKLMKSLHETMGLNISLFDINENLITSYPEKDSEFCYYMKYICKQSKHCCKKCDHKAFQRAKASNTYEVYRCDFHLFETCVPIYTYGTLTGFLMIGQATNSSQIDLDLIKKSIKPFIKNQQIINSLVDTIPIREEKQLLAFAEIANLAAQYLTLSNQVENKNHSLAYAIKIYIQNNYQHTITMDSLCDLFLCSKSTLNNHFKKENNITIHQYLLDYRLKKSCELLNQNQLTTQEIAYLCGFNDSNHFYKAFKNKYKCNPGTYKNK